MHSTSIPTGLLAGLLLATVAWGQGTGPYLNFETPQLDPVAVATVGGQDYVLVCNTPDNAVEIYEAGGTNAFVARVPTGLEPVTVVVRPDTLPGSRRRCYTANWLGDSITMFEIAPGSPTGLAVKVIRTVEVGDEPMGLAFLPDTPGVSWTDPTSPFHLSLMVTFSTLGAWSLRDSTSLIPLHPAWYRIELQDDGTSANEWAIKDPRAIAFAPTQAGVAPKMFVLNHRGGTDHQMTGAYDYDLWSALDLPTSSAIGRATGPRITGLGSTNANMAFNANGDLYVIGMESLADTVSPLDAFGESRHLAQATTGSGFVTSNLYRIKNVTTPSPSAPESFDFNTSPSTSQRVVQPKDLAIVDLGGGAAKIYVTGFSSDTVGVVTTNAGNPSTWTLAVIDVNAGGFSPTNLGGSMRGPYGIALSAAAGRAFVSNRLDHTLTVIDTTTDQIVRTVPLQADPRPPEVQVGAKWNYSSKLSGNRVNACGSCHVDSHLDGVAWNLSGGNGFITPANLLPLAILPFDDPRENPDFKGPMVTQTLRGIPTSQMADPVVSRALFSSEPLHWRGDKGVFEHFNAAYVNLMGLNIPGVSVVNQPDPQLNKGVTDAMMREYRDFVMTVHYPPNPEQDRDRTYSGSFYDATHPDPPQLQASNPLVGSGGELGLKMFHATPVTAIKCAGCHALPEGSDNLVTERFTHAGLPMGKANAFETAQLRGLVNKEKRLIRPDSGSVADTSVITAEFGLIHNGADLPATTPPPFGSNSVHSFVLGFQIMVPSLEEDLARFVRQLDTGVAPMVGFAFTVEQPVYAVSSNQVPIQNLIASMQAQVEAGNIGLSVHARLTSGPTTTRKGFWYDVTPTQPAYVEEPWSGGGAALPPQSLPALLANVDATASADNILVFQCTPLGSARRVAFLDPGLPGPVSTMPLTPSNITLEPCPTNTANVNIPQIEGFWSSSAFWNVNPLPGGYASFRVNVGTAGAGREMFITRLLQRALWQFGEAHSRSPNLKLGVTTLHHESPRRFRVKGDGIRHGAWLRLLTPAPNNPANPTAPSFNPNDPLSLAIEMPLFQTRDAMGNVGWETAAEIKPEMLYALMLGWLWAPAVSPVLGSPPTFTAPRSEDSPPWNPGYNPLASPKAYYPDPATGPLPFDPATWNFYFVEVVNDRGTAIERRGNGGWQRLKVL